jgi:hypothetical protein
MLCDFLFEHDGDRLRATCARCGRVARVKSRRVYAACRASAQPISRQQLADIVSSGADPDGWKPAKIGDLLERGLKAVGITEARVTRWTRARECGCSARRSALNAWGERQQRRIRKAAKAVAQAYFGQ